MGIRNVDLDFYVAIKVRGFITSIKKYEKRKAVNPER